MLLILTWPVHSPSVPTVPHAALLNNVCALVSKNNNNKIMCVCAGVSPEDVHSAILDANVAQELGASELRRRVLRLLLLLPFVDDPAADADAGASAAATSAAP
jgi:hypothetical protein